MTPDPQKTRLHRRQGFTLIEVILTLMIVGIVATLAGVGIADIVKGYVFTKDNSNTALKGQIALTRLTKEFSMIRSVDPGNDRSITYRFMRDGSEQERKVSWSGIANDPLLFDDTHILIDNVTGFSLAYFTAHDDSAPAAAWSADDTRSIGITLSVKGASDVVSTFATRVFPRNGS